MGLSVKLENDVRTIIPRKTGFANKEKHRSSDNPSRSSPKQREYWQKGQNEAVQEKKKGRKNTPGGVSPAAQDINRRQKNIEVHRGCNSCEYVRIMCALQMRLLEAKTWAGRQMSEMGGFNE